ALVGRSTIPDRHRVRARSPLRSALDLSGLDFFHAGHPCADDRGTTPGTGTSAPAARLAPARQRATDQQATGIPARDIARKASFPRAGAGEGRADRARRGAAQGWDHREVLSGDRAELHARSPDRGPGNDGRHADDRYARSRSP
ncbi:MAG: Transcriptional regulator, ArsR family, partial [uncultured Thermomicrobiales bacterium]